MPSVQSPKGKRSTVVIESESWQCGTFLDFCIQPKKLQYILRGQFTSQQLRDCKLLQLLQQDDLVTEAAKMTINEGAIFPISALR